MNRPSADFTALYLGMIVEGVTMLMVFAAVFVWCLILSGRV